MDQVSATPLCQGNRLVTPLVPMHPVRVDLSYSSGTGSLWQVWGSAVYLQLALRLQVWVERRR